MSRGLTLGGSTRRSRHATWASPSYRVVPHALGHVLLIAVLDNLGKGAAGAAVQNLNLMLGLDERLGLGETDRRPSAAA